MTQTFNPGDMVIYKERRSSNSVSTQRNGSVGEVIGLFPGYERNKKAYHVRWISGYLEAHGPTGVWTENLDPVMYKYDPEQTGDTEEDI